MLVPRWLQKARQIQDLLLLADFQFFPHWNFGEGFLYKPIFCPRFACLRIGRYLCIFFLDLGVNRFLKWSLVQICFHILPSCQVAGHFGNFSVLHLAKGMVNDSTTWHLFNLFRFQPVGNQLFSDVTWNHYEALNIMVPWPIKQQMPWELCTKSKWPLRVRPLPIEFLPLRKTVAPDSTAGRGVPSRSLRTFNGWSVMSQSSIRAMLNLHGFFLKRCPVLHL